MDRRSDKHGPLLDEEMEQETRGLTQGAPVDSRAEEWHEPEPSGEGEPLVTLEPDPGAPKHDIGEAGEPADGAPPPAARDDRAAVAAYLRRSVFPAKRDRLIQEARGNNAPDQVINELRRLDGDSVYHTAAHAWAAATGMSEHEHRF